MPHANNGEALSSILTYEAQGVKGNESREVLSLQYAPLALLHRQTAYRITVRQLESMIRLSEALARLHLDEQVRRRARVLVSGLVLPFLPMCWPISALASLLVWPKEQKKNCKEALANLASLEYEHMSHYVPALLRSLVPPSGQSELLCDLGVET